MTRASFTPDLPPVWLLLFGLLAYWLARLVPIWRFDVAPLGTVLIGGALMLIGWSAFWFWRKKTPIEPRHVPKALIVEGPYRINRNPIYTGLILVLAGYALNRGALTGLLPALGFPLILTHRFVIPEERALLEAFGQAAQDYLDRTRRWV